MVLPVIWLVGISQVGVSAGMATERIMKYRQARDAADLSGKPMLVVGGPYGSPIQSALIGAAHGHGDT